MSARQSVYRLDRSSGQETSIRMAAYALLDVADAIREHTAATPTDSGVSTTSAPSPDGIPSPVNRESK